MSLLEAIILGIVQGLTEFLPVSSTAHLRFFDASAGFTAVVQLGTLAAALIYFRKEVALYLKAWFKNIFSLGKEKTTESNLAWGVVIGTIPIAVIGYAFQDQIEGPFRSYNIVAWTLIGFGLIMLAADKLLPKYREEREINFLDGVVVGCFQALSLVPGVSRSGSTITGAYTRGLDRRAAARYSFLLSLPAIFTAGIYSAYKHRSEMMSDGLANVIVATLFAFIVGWAVIDWMIKFVSKHGLTGFVVYRIILGIVILVLVGSGKLDPNKGLEQEFQTPQTTSAKQVSHVS